ncbi:MAG: 2,3-bisphosphoglycerate-independent phosphoglycerate mutase [Candidatus Omnitrophica bacterium]|nr:2,3-bisphosphoglycerate-independent phosphoglycerate mutase [Candidatus Omnitrophota bacterium]
MHKILYIVLDGLGDLAIEELGNKTPVEAADTPNLDNLARLGKTGLLYPVKKGLAPESDIAVISLLGYDALKHYTGRGPLESFAEGLKVEKGDLALRVNFATVEDDGKTIRDRRVGRTLETPEAAALSKEINEKVVLTGASFEFKNTIGHRGVLVIRTKKKNLSGWITNIDPAYGREGVFGIALEVFSNSVSLSRPMSGLEDSEGAILAARLVNQFTTKSHKVLQACIVNKKRVSEHKLPANIILSRDAGNCLPEFPSINSLYNLRFGSFVEMPVEKGIALLTGMDVVDVQKPTGDLEVDYSIWARIAEAKIKEFDGLYIHIKGPDEPAHEGDFYKKKEIIEAIDKFFFTPLLEKINLNQTVIAVTADHSTVCKIKAHSADPVPVLVCGAGISSDGSENFSEKTAQSGSLGELFGRQLLPLLIKFSHG